MARDGIKAGGINSVAAIVINVTDGVVAGVVVDGGVEDDAEAAVRAVATVGVRVVITGSATGATAADAIGGAAAGELPDRTTVTDGGGERAANAAAVGTDGHLCGLSCVLLPTFRLRLHRVRRGGSGGGCESSGCRAERRAVGGCAGRCMLRELSALRREGSRPIRNHSADSAWGRLGLGQDVLRFVDSMPERQVVVEVDNTEAGFRPVMVVAARVEASFLVDAFVAPGLRRPQDPTFVANVELNLRVDGRQGLGRCEGFGGESRDPLAAAIPLRGDGVDECPVRLVAGGWGRVVRHAGSRLRGGSCRGGAPNSGECRNYRR
jgi:hypothetical protein